MIPFFTFIFSSYAIFAVIGFLCALIFLFFRMERFDIDFGMLIFYIIIGTIGLLLGSRLMFIISCIPKLIIDFSISKLAQYIFNGGIVFYGGLLGALTAIETCSKIKKQDTRKIFNYFTPAFPLFHVWGRIGCFFGGCCYGKPWNWGLPMAADPETVRIPVQLMESLCNIIIFIGLILYEKRSKKENISLLPIYLVSYAFCRFILEFFRGDSLRGLWGVLSTSQIISIIILLCCFILGRKNKLKGNKFEKVEQEGEL